MLRLENRLESASWHRSLGPRDLLARIAERLDHGAAAVPASLEQDRSDDSCSTQHFRDLLPGHLWSINYCSDVYDVYFSCNDMLKYDDILWMSHSVDVTDITWLSAFFLCGFNQKE